jgi:hypothetical protein
MNSATTVQHTTNTTDPTESTSQSRARTPSNTAQAPARATSVVATTIGSGCIPTLLTLSHPSSPVRYLWRLRSGRGFRWVLCDGASWSLVRVPYLLGWGYARSRCLTLQHLPGPGYILAFRLEVQVLTELDHLRLLVGQVVDEPRVAGTDAQERSGDFHLPDVRGKRSFKRRARPPVSPQPPRPHRGSVATRRCPSPWPRELLW